MSERHQVSDFMEEWEINGCRRQGLQILKSFLLLALAQEYF
jgi:hypothetical protein